MASLEERAALVGLLRSLPKNWRWVTHCVDLASSALAVWRGDAVLRDCEPGPDLLPPMVDLAPIVAEIAGWERQGYTFATVLDDNYPGNLRTIYNRPPFVFIQGSLVPADHRSVAIVGTRKATQEGLARARRLSKELASKGITVVSGLAAGIDTAAHTAALEAGGRTLAVIGTGIRRFYPAENRGLQERIGKEGAVLSQFWPDAPPKDTNFPIRNVVTSGMAMATCVIEASYTSGAKMQARLALEHGRWVFLLQSLVEQHKWAEAYATRPGTTVVSSTDEIVRQLEKLMEPPRLPEFALTLSA